MSTEELSPRPRAATAERRTELLNYLRVLRRAQTLEELTSHFGISPSTVRRDVEALADQGQVWKIAGGRVTVRRREATLPEKTVSSAASKMAMAEYAAMHLIHAGDVVLLDSGTSTAFLARLLAQRDDLTLVVAGVSSLLALAEGPADVVVVGGHLRKTSGSLLGPLALSGLDSIMPSVAFIGCDSLDTERGINCSGLEAAAFKRRAMEVSQESWVLADETKLSATPSRPAWIPFLPQTGLLTVTPRSAASRATLKQFRADGHDVRVTRPAMRREKAAEA